MSCHVCAAYALVALRVSKQHASTTTACGPHQPDLSGESASCSKGSPRRSSFEAVVIAIKCGNLSLFVCLLDPLSACRLPSSLSVGQVDKGRLWLFEQEQTLGGSNVTTVIRMTVLKLKSGGLWVHAPVAPTRQVSPLHNWHMHVPSVLCCVCELYA